ncbi:Hypothetical protein CINCED_3A022385, partial [Cinara cedri]
TNNNWSLPNSSHVDFKYNIIYFMSEVDSFLTTISAILLFLLVTCMCFTVQFAERKHKYHKAITTLDSHSNMGSDCSMLNYNDHMVSSTTLQSHIPPILDILDIDENQDDADKEHISLNGSEIDMVPENIVNSSSKIDQCASFVSQTSLSSRQIITQSTSTLNDKPRNLKQNPLTSSTDSSIHGHDVSDLEMDYYDYNVQNTNSMPGSYIGMDPAYCLWIPPISDISPGGHESMEMSIFDIKNDKCRQNCEISSKYSNRLSADSESTLVSDDCISLKTLKSSPRTYFNKEKQKAEYINNDSIIKFVDEDDAVDLKEVTVYVDNKATYTNFSHIN